MKEHLRRIDETDLEMKIEEYGVELKNLFETYQNNLLLSQNYLLNFIDLLTQKNTKNPQKKSK